MVKHTLSAALLGCVLCSLSPAQAQIDCSQALGRIDVQGEGKALADPDLAELNFTIRATGKNARETRAAVEKNMASFINSLVAAGVKKEQIAADNITLNIRYVQDKNNKRLFDGYDATRSVRVDLEDFSLIPQITDIAMDSGLNGIEGFVYKIKDESALKVKAQEDAIADAKAKAARLASGFGIKDYRPCNLSFMESGARHYAMPMLMKASARSLGASNDAVEAEYTSDKLTISASVAASFVIVQDD